jgi:hypothetical protein
VTWVLILLLVVAGLVIALVAIVAGKGLSRASEDDPRMWNLRRGGSYPVTEEERSLFALKPEDRKD